MDGSTRLAGAVQPRPALGRRPWFAFERRARSFLRFAFAMTGSVPAATGYRAGQHVVVVGAGWRFEPVFVAASFSERRRGLRPRSLGRGLLLATGSVHGFGMAEPLLVVFVSGSGHVIGWRRLSPRQVMRCPSVWTLELPICTPPPAVGTLLRVLPSSAPCPAP